MREPPFDDARPRHEAHLPRGLGGQVCRRISQWSIKSPAKGEVTGDEISRLVHRRNCNLHVLNAVLTTGRQGLAVGARALQRNITALSHLNRLDCVNSCDRIRAGWWIELEPYFVACVADAMSDAFEVCVSGRLPSPRGRDRPTEQREKSKHERALAQRGTRATRALQGPSLFHPPACLRPCAASAPGSTAKLPAAGLPPRPAASNAHEIKIPGRYMRSRRRDRSIAQ